MPTYTFTIRDDEGTREIGIPADSLEEATRIAYRDQLPVVDWTAPVPETPDRPRQAPAPPPASSPPSAPSTTPDIARLIEQNERLYTLLKDIKKDGIGLSKRTHRRLRSAIGWQVFFALLAFAFLFPIILFIFGLLLAAFGSSVAIWGLGGVLTSIL